MALHSMIGLTFSLVIAINVVAMYQFNSTTLRPWISMATSIMRRRYCLLMSVAPALLGVISLKSHNMLFPLLLVRQESAFWDIFLITLISCLTSAVGLALCRLVDRHGPERFPPSNPEIVNVSDYSDDWRRNLYSDDWSQYRYVNWWICGLICPSIVALTSYTECTGNDVVRSVLKWLLITGIFLGVHITFLVALFAAILSQCTLSNIDNASTLGILPFEGIVRPIRLRMIGNRSFLGEEFVRWLFGNPATGFSRLLRGPGYTSKSGVLLLAQAQVISFVSFGAVAYVLFYYVSLNDCTLGERATRK